MIKTEEMEKLPEGWKRVRLGEVLGYEQPTNYIVETESYDERFGIPVLTPGKTFVLGYTNEKEGIFKDIPVVIFDDFTTESRYINFPFKVKSSALKILKMRDNRNNLYFVYNTMQILNFKPGSEHKRFWISEYSKLEIPLPPLPEQQKIAEILETVDSAIENTDAIIEKYKRIKQGLMQDLLTRGIVENYELGIMNYGSELRKHESGIMNDRLEVVSHESEIGNWELRDERKHKFKDSPLGRIPEEWEVVSLGEVAFITMGQSPSSSLINKDEQGLPFLQGNAEFTNKHPNPINWIEKPLKIANKDSILISVRAPVGALNLANTQYCIGRGLASIRVNNNLVDNHFLWYSIHFLINELVKLGQGSTFGAIGSNELKALEIPLPPLPEQRRIASILSQVDEVIEKEQKYKEKLERIKRGLMEDLLTGRIRVGLEL